MDPRTLAARDPALAALVGAIGADFGWDAVADYSGGGDASYDDFGFEFGQDATTALAAAAPTQTPIHSLMGRFGASHPAAMAQAHGAAAAQMAAAGAPGAGAQAQTAALWAAAAQQHQATQSRQRLLEPNGDSSVKVERFGFAISDVIAHLGTAQALTASGAPSVNLRPQRVTMNALIPGFATVTTLAVANLLVLVGGIFDAFDFNANGVGQHLDIPTLSPANSATFTGQYTGVTPLEYGSSTASYLFTVTFKGPATMSA